MNWNLEEGKYKKDVLSNKEIEDTLESFFMMSNKTTSYKFCFLQILIDLCDSFNEDYESNYDVLSESVTEIYWNIYFRNGLKQINPNSRWQSSSIENLINEFSKENNIDTDIFFSDILDKDKKNDLIKKVGKIFTKYVIGAFYGDTKGLLYSFSKNNQKIILQPDFHLFLKEWGSKVAYENILAWSKFLKKINPYYSIDEILLRLKISLTIKKYNNGKKEKIIFSNLKDDEISLKNSSKTFEEKNEIEIKKINKIFQENNGDKYYKIINKDENKIFLDFQKNIFGNYRIKYRITKNNFLLNFLKIPRELRLHFSKFVKISNFPEEEYFLRFSQKDDCLYCIKFILNKLNIKESEIVFLEILSRDEINLYNEEEYINYLLKLENKDTNKNEEKAIEDILNVIFKD